jgi:hypothetical protein
MIFAINEALREIAEDHGCTHEEIRNTLQILDFDPVKTLHQFMDKM